MARKDTDDLSMEDELVAAFIDDDNTTIVEQEANTEIEPVSAEDVPTDPDTGAEEWVDTTDDFPGQLAVDVYETADKLIVKARTAGINKSDLNVTIADNILTISGVLSGGEDDRTTRWHIQECYWGEFSRTIALPVQVREDEGSVKAELKDGVLTITFDKERIEPARKIKIQ